MTTSPEELTLAGDFPTATGADWRNLVRAVLVKSGMAGAQTARAPEDLLASTTYDGITIAPLYTRADHVPDPGLPGLPPFIRGGRPEGGVTTGWDVRAKHGDPDPAAANDAILTDLNNGVSSLWLVAGQAGIPLDGLATALSGVMLDLAPVTLDAGFQVAEAAAVLLGVHADQGLPEGAVGGNLGADPIGVAARTGAPPATDVVADLAIRYARRYPGLRTVMVDALPYHEAGGSEAEELGCSLATAVAYLRALTAAGLDVDAAAGQLEFRYAVTDEQFLGIAKLRAARRLWARVTEVAGVDPPRRAQRQHVVTSTAMLTRRDPWVNLLRGTVACVAAGIGGADAVTVLPFDSTLGLPNSFGHRMARNTQAILLEESRLAAVIDPAGGSWYVEALTAELARKAWDVFTDIERAGGIVAELASGALARRLARTWSRRRANIANRSDAITGVSEFPDLTQEPIRRPPAPPGPSGGLPVVRYAEDFEVLRDRSDQTLAQTGSRPAVFLATLGPLAEHAARASFAANLLRAGGIEAPAAGPTREVGEVVAAFTASGLRMACVCGTDQAYAEHGAELVAALRAAGASYVLLAGRPSTGDGWAGVDEFVYQGGAALDTLTNIWRIVEAGPR